MSGNTYQQVREISHSLIPQEFKEQSFTDLVTDYLQQLSEGQKIDLQFSVFPEKEINKISEKIQIAIFNMIKELVTNAIKHAYAN